MAKHLLSFLRWIFTGFLGYYQSGMLLTSHYIFKKPVFIPAVLTTELFISWPILRSCEKETMVRLHPLQTFWNLAITNSLSDWWHWVISEWKWSSAHSLVSPAELALNPVSKNALLSNSRYFWKAPQLQEYFFPENHLRNKILPKIFICKALRFSVLHFSWNLYTLLILFHFPTIAVIKLPHDILVTALV